MAARVSAPRARPERPPDATGQLVTREQLASMPDGEGRTELILGRVVRMPPAFAKHCGLSGNIAVAAGPSMSAAQPCQVLIAEPGFMLRRRPDTVRVPDVAFVLRERYDAAVLAGGYVEGPPDIAVEVISESQARAQLEDKVAEYLEAGGRLVWVIDPEARVARVYRPGSQVEEVAADGVLSGEDVIPGLMVPLADVFR